MPRTLTAGNAAAVLLGGAAALTPLPSVAADYNVDCAVILCMAAGFLDEPSETCSGAYDYMIDRITDIPPKPPFDTCTMSDGSATTRPRWRSPALPDSRARAGPAPGPAPMGFSETADYTFVPPACYPDAEYVPSLLEGRPGYWFLGAPVAAERAAYRFQVTIPTGAGGAPYVSPVFLSNPETGFSIALTDEDHIELEQQPTLPEDAP
jgi:hypothetical protein